ncbi:cytochrome P450 [Nostoc sp. 3335mG]|nr:cytochrome P450 [Nostoc sp. 3335mG]
MGAEPVRAQDYDPFKPAVMQDPLPFYRELRRDQPVLYLPEYDGYFFSRFDDILELLKHIDNSFLQSEGSLPTPAAVRAHNAEPPARPTTTPFPISQSLGMPVHGQVRRAHIKPMLNKGVAELRQFVRDLANERLDLLLPRGRFNLTADFGGIVSSSVIMHLMGMPLDLARECLDIVNSGTRTDPELGGFDSRATAMKAIQFYLPWVEKRFEEGADGSVPMVDGLINWRFEGRALTPPEVAQNLVCAFIGGIETTPKITAHGLMELNDRPGQMAAVRADLAANVPKVTEEMIRYCAPAQWFMRTAHKPVTVAGQEIRPGQRAFAMIASGLRDEREFDAPDEFRWNRPIPRVLSFGYGMHVCIGVHLARMEIQVMVDAFLRRVQRYRFDMDAAVRHPSSFQWGWNELPVIIEEGA